MSVEGFEESDSGSALSVLGGLQKHDDKTFDKVATAGKYLPRLQLFSFNSNEVKDEKIKAGRWGVITMKGQPVIDLTDTMILLLCVWRPKALDMSNTDNVVSCFNVDDPEFISISDRSEDTDSGCMFGPEYLVWIPSIERFATLFCGSKTMRRESVNIKSYIGKMVTLKSRLITKGKYKWHGPVGLECNTPQTMPDRDELLRQCEEFNNPPDRDEEPVAETAGTNRDR